MALNYDTAKAIVEEAHRAWSATDIDAVLRTYADDIWFQRNAADMSSAPLVVQGRAAMGDFLRDIASKAPGMATVESFQFHSGIGRSRVRYFLRDRETGQSLSGTYRQIVMFRGMLISRIEQFHDAARLAAFFRLIEAQSVPVDTR
jgi:ketosteroid isomerase-like protein